MLHAPERKGLRPIGMIFASCQPLTTGDEYEYQNVPGD